MKRTYKITSIQQSSHKEKAFQDSNWIQVTFTCTNKDDADKLFKEYERLMKEDM